MHKIKRYVNRKLYDTTDKKYVTMDHVASLIHAGEEIVVTDNKTGENITSVIVSQLLARDQKVRDNDVPAGMLVQLLRKGHGTIVSYGKKYVNIWQRALTAADEEIDKLINHLVSEHELSKSEGSKLKVEIKSHAEDFKNWVNDKIDVQIKDILSKMNLTSRDHLKNLSDQIEELTRKVKELEKAKTGDNKKAGAAAEKRKSEEIEEEVA